HVFDITTGRELVEPVIPRGKFRIYVPLRIFKALRYAHEIAQGSLDNTGLLSPAFHDNLGKLGVGVCDGIDSSSGVPVNNCAYRTQPFTPASPANVGPDPPISPIQGGNFCPSETAALSVLEGEYPTNVPLKCDSLAASIGLCTAGSVIAHYDPANAISRAAALNELVKGVINQKVTVELDLPETDDFELLTDSIDIEPRVSNFTSKYVQFAGIVGPAVSEAKCTKLVETNVTLSFAERDLDYIVVDTRAPLEYDVRIVDTFAAENTTIGTCVSYCLDQATIGGITDLFIFGGTLAPNSALCERTACAAPGTYNEKPTCGNGVIDAGEQCEGENQTACVALGFSTGTATCNSATCLYNTSTCSDSICGNGVVEAGEQCEGSNVSACPFVGSTCALPGAPNACTCIAPPIPV
ncbi:MAG: hypothetical protein AABY11_00440, partial [archaeon]